MPEVEAKGASVLGVQRRVNRPVRLVFPEDFPQRLDRFKEASGMSWRRLALLLGISTYRLREWRFRRVIPGSAHLFCLLTIAEALELRDGVLMCPDRDVPDGMGLKEFSQ